MQVLSKINEAGRSHLILKKTYSQTLFSISTATSDLGSRGALSCLTVGWLGDLGSKSIQSRKMKMTKTSNATPEKQNTLEETRGRDPRGFSKDAWEDLGFKLEPMKAIRAKCIDCCGGSRSEVRKCQVTSCDLYPLRMGHRPKPKDKGSKEAQVSPVHGAIDNQGSEE